MTDQTPRTEADAIIAQHRPCGPKYEGCYSHFPMPHCRADGMMLPCDVMRLAQARAGGLDENDTDILDRRGRDWRSGYDQARTEGLDELREAAQAVVDTAEPDEGFEGYIEFLVPADAIEKLRAILAARRDEG